MAITSEPVLGLAVMQVLATCAEGKANVRTLIAGVPKYVKLTADDLAQSETRKHEAVWEQRVRNLKSHSKSEGNVIGEGYVAHVARGTYQLTDPGWAHLKNKKLA